MIEARLKELIAQSLEIPLGDVDDRLVRGETPAWDSLNHLRLITAVESEFGVTFTMDQILGIQRLTELQQMIEARTSQH